MHNAFVHLRDKPEWKAAQEKGIRIYNWENSDPLSDVFLSQFGCYPSVEETGFDYRAAIMEATKGSEHTLSPSLPISAETLDYLTISSISRYGLKRHHSVAVRQSYPGFFVGDASSLDDLVCYWNLRACDLPLCFVDPNHMERYSEALPAWKKSMQDYVANYRHEWDRRIAVWTRHEQPAEVCNLFRDINPMCCQVSGFTWNGLNISAPTMHLGEVSVLGVMGSEQGKPKVSFALTDKPFCGDVWFHQQHLVASVSFIGGLYGDEQNTPLMPHICLSSMSSTRARCTLNTTNFALNQSALA